MQQRKRIALTLYIHTCCSMQRSLYCCIIFQFGNSQTANGRNTISSADWSLDPVELAGKFNPRTKAIILNTPNNPMGKVYTKEELQVIADLCMKHDVLCISDEVYEWLIYPGNKHVKIG
ncbi:hypothetical protein FKM82_027207, partial [Ascaphus truei]